MRCEPTSLGRPTWTHGRNWPASVTSGCKSKTGFNSTIKGGTHGPEASALSLAPTRLWRGAANSRYGLLRSHRRRGRPPSEQAEPRKKGCSGIHPAGPGFLARLAASRPAWPDNAHPHMPVHHQLPVGPPALLVHMPCGVYGHERKGCSLPVYIQSSRSHGWRRCPGLPTVALAYPPLP